MAGIIATLLLFIITLLLLIGFHELGHFTAARACGIKVLRFSIGFGKGLFKWHDRHGTEWVIAAFPIGGYVKLLDEREGSVKKEELQLSFNRHPIWQRFIVLIAGPLFNIIFAFFAFWLMYTVGPYFLTPVIASVTPHSIAANAQVKPNSTIIKVNSTPTKSWQDVSFAIIRRLGDKTTMQIKTKPLDSDNVVTHHLNLNTWELKDKKVHLLKSLGFVPIKIKSKTDFKKWVRTDRYPVYSAWIPALHKTYQLTALNVIILGKLITGKISLFYLGGPLGIAQGISLTRHQFTAFLFFLSLISIALAIVNALPIPGLDGGHILFLIIEGIRGKPVSVAVEALAIRLGIIFLVVIFIHATINDLARFIS